MTALLMDQLNILGIDDQGIDSNILAVIFFGEGKDGSAVCQKGLPIDS